MVTIVKSLVGTDVNYAEAQVRTRGTCGLRLQIPTGGGSMVELDFNVDSDTYDKIYSLLAVRLLADAAKPVPVVKPMPVALTLEERVANIEGFLGHAADQNILVFSVKN